MKILVISQYFYPENFKINDIILGLKSQGHELTVLTGKPNYPYGKFFSEYSFFTKNFELWNGIKIYRSPLFTRGKGSGLRLFMNYISFAFFASVRQLFIKESFDKIFVYQPSPITVGFPAIVAKNRFKAPIYFWVQDLWPESLSAAGGINNSVVLNLADLITKYIYKNSKKIFVQSKAFIPYLNRQNVKPEKIFYLPNSTESFYKPLKSSRFKNVISEKKHIKIFFAGNLGEAQSLDTMVKATEILTKRKINLIWYILGDGRQKPSLIKLIDELKLNLNFKFLGSFPSKDMPHFFSMADALFVSLKKNKIFSLTIPNKIQSYMACAKPIIASIDGEGARIINEANCGITSPAESVNDLVESIIKFNKLDDNQKKIMGNNAKSYFKKEFERNILLKKLIKFIDDK